MTNEQSREDRECYGCGAAIEAGQPCLQHDETNRTYCDWQCVYRENNQEPPDVPAWLRMEWSI